MQDTALLRLGSDRSKGQITLEMEDPETAPARGKLLVVVNKSQLCESRARWMVDVGGGKTRDDSATRGSSAPTDKPRVVLVFADTGSSVAAYLFDGRLEVGKPPT